MELIKENKKKFGLDQDYVKSLKLPQANKVRVYNLRKIIDSRRKIQTIDKIEHLYKIKKNLEKKLKILRAGKEIKEFEYTTYPEWK